MADLDVILWWFFKCSGSVASNELAGCKIYLHGYDTEKHYFWDVTPYSVVDTCCYNLQGTKVVILYTSSWNMEVVRSSENVGKDLSD